MNEFNIWKKVYLRQFRKKNLNNVQMITFELLSAILLKFLSKSIWNRVIQKKWLLSNNNENTAKLSEDFLDLEERAFRENLLFSISNFCVSTWI